MSGESDLSAAIAEVQVALERLRLAADRSATSSQGWDFVDPPAAGSAGRQTARGSRSRVLSPEQPPTVSPSATRAAPTRAETASSFAPCPQYCLDICSRLSSSSLSASERATRAWTAGLWAKEVLEGRWGTPLPSVSVSLRPTVYVVLRCSDLPEPARFNTYTAFRRAVGPLEESDAVCHSFPSLAEARVYCYAAGIPLPHLRQ